MKKIVFFTGAGISQESGLATFRDAKGIWSQYDPDEVCSARAYRNSRHAVLDFHNKVRAAVDAAEPNAAHRLIASLESRLSITVITQNIDDLHERAGSTNILELHGDIHTASVKRYRTPAIPWNEDILPDSLPEAGWERSRGTMRHDVVLFGENVKHLSAASRVLKEADVLVVIGTSLQVFPAAALIHEARQAYKIMVDPKPFAEAWEVFDEVHVDTAVGGMRVVEKNLLSDLA